MRICAFFMLPFLFAAARPQESPGAENFRVRHLSLVSSSLPDAQRRLIVGNLEGIETDANAEELAERVRQQLRDAGYYKAEVSGTQISDLRPSNHARFADVSFRVDPGALYTLGEIRFEGGHVFAAETMRAQFATRSGELFNATAIGMGLDKLKNLYASKAYFNFGAIPKPIIDESTHVVSLTIDMDEGLPCKAFGGLVLEGVEPVAGAGTMLLDSWNKEVRGKLYSPDALKAWLGANTATWPGDTAAKVSLDYGCGGTSGDMAVRVTLHFQ